MNDPYQPLLELVLQAIAESSSADEEHSDAPLPQREALRQSLALALQPLVWSQAQSIMRGKPGGLNLSDAHDLAMAGLLHFVDPDHMGILRFKGQSVGELVTFVRLKLKGMRIDDLRKLTGRAPKRASVDAAPSDDKEASDESPPLSEEERTRKSQASPYLPRVYVDVVDDEGNEFLPSERRSATGYLLLKQTKKLLHDYLALVPGSVVQVPYGPRSKKQGTKKVTLTKNHARLLRVWMSGDGDLQWKEVAEEMGTAEGNVKRWWSVVVVAFQADNSPQAQALRGLYRINPTHTRMASEELEKQQEDDGDAKPA